MDQQPLELLLDEERLKSARKQAENKAAELSSEEWKKMRVLAKTDLFFLAYSILGYTKLSVNLHGAVCTWMKENEKARFREILLPRGHFKSTLVTIADSIRLALPNDSNANIWPECLGTDIRILLSHETHTSASNLFLGPIINHFLGNPLLMALFPECVPDPKKHRINKNELELPRTSFWGEPTFDTLGQGGRAQGRHYNKIKLDDIIGDKARDSTVEMQAAKNWLDNIESLFSTFRLDSFDLVGTRWSYDDVYSHAHQTYGQDLAKYIRPVEELNPETKLKESIFPEEFPPEELVRLRKKPRIWNAQYLNDPSQSGNGFSKEWLQYYYYINKVKISHFAGLRRENVTHLINELDIIFLIDPAPDNESGFVITGTNTRMRTFILEANKHNWTPPDFVKFLFEKVVQYRPRLVVIEEVLFSKLYKHYWQSQMQLRNVKFRVEGCKTGNKDKGDRIYGLSTLFEDGSLVANEGHEDFLEEYRQFGNVKPDNLHLLDALCQGIGRWRLPSKQFGDGTEDKKEIVRKLDRISGYSKV